MKDKVFIVFGIVSAIVLILESFQFIILSDTISWLFVVCIMMFTFHFANTLSKSNKKS